MLFNTPLLNGPVAQLVEQRIENPRVDSSILSQATKKINDLAAKAARSLSFLGYAGVTS